MKANERCANELAKWLAKNELNGDLLIYINGKRYYVNNNGELVYDIDANPKDYFDYAGNFLSMSFEGGFYYVMNCAWERMSWERLENQFRKIIGKYGKYYELGDAWNLSLYE